MMLLVVVAVVLFLLAVGLITTLATISRRERRPEIEVFEPKPKQLHASGELSVESEPLSLAPSGQGDYLSWNDIVFQKLKAHYPTLDGSLNDYLYRYQQDNS